ncbi:MAG: metallopeptidase TldD-related protein, partial [Capsulimonadaceae bacterium]
MKSTHNASRGLAGTPGIGCGNLYVEAGTLTAEQIIAEVPAGLYVTSLIGFGVNAPGGHGLRATWRNRSRSLVADAGSLQARICGIEVGGTSCALLDPLRRNATLARPSRATGMAPGGVGLRANWRNPSRSVVANSAGSLRARIGGIEGGGASCALLDPLRRCRDWDGSRHARPERPAWQPAGTGCGRTGEIDRGR